MTTRHARFQRRAASDDAGSLRQQSHRNRSDLTRSFQLPEDRNPGLAASSGMAVLDCNNEVRAANTLFSLEASGSLVSEALIESAEEVVAGPDSFAWFPADHRGGARFGVAVANPSNQPLDVIVTMFDTRGQTVVDATVNVDANASKAFFVDELGTVPPDLFGQVLISPSNNPGPSVYTIGCGSPDSCSPPFRRSCIPARV